MLHFQYQFSTMHIIMTMAVGCVIYQKVQGTLLVSQIHHALCGMLTVVINQVEGKATGG